MTTKKDILKKIQNLVQYKNKTPEELDIIAEEMLAKEKEAQELSSIEWIGLSKKEKEKATEKYKQYREKYNISKLSDTEDLKTLIQTEIIIERIQEKIGAEERIPKKGIIDSLTSLQRQVNELKARLGLHTEDKKNDFDRIQLLKKKYRKWMDENQLSRETKCPNCSKVFLLRMRTDKYEPQKHPYLKDNILCNEHLLKLYKEQKITKEDVANVLGCGVFYVDWILNKLEEKENAG